MKIIIWNALSPSAGHALVNTEAYDPNSDQWSVLEGSPAAILDIARSHRAIRKPFNQAISATLMRAVIEEWLNL